MSQCRFGTDGVRGRVGADPIVPDTLLRLGYAIGKVLGGPGREVVVGKDTRLSGYMVESAIEAGLSAAGIDTALIGPAPTSAVAWLVGEEQAAAGIVISASHNPHYDNGIKLFDSLGNKLSDRIEKNIEQLVDAGAGRPKWAAEPGKVRRIDDALERYVEFCLATAPGLSLKGQKILVDAANGAAYLSAPAVLRRLGAKVVEFGCAPDGRNINVSCGALVPELAAKLVVEQQCDCGIVLDGDADRLILIDGRGEILGGDVCLYVLCRALAAVGKPPAGAVGTVVSNEALAAALDALGVQFARSAVGDRNIARELASRKWLYGAEPSGHMLLLDRHVTGDGVIAALGVLQALSAAGMSLAEAASSYTPMPSKSVSLKVDDPKRACQQLHEVVSDELQRDEIGRIVIRPSGTEPVVRLLVEANSQRAAQQAVQRIARKAKLLRC